MSRLSLLVSTARHFWRGSLAVAVGVLVATAVITGALIVGDSVQSSLVKMHLDRLGRVDLAVVGRDRFVREDLATDLEDRLGQVTGGMPRVAPLIMMRGSLESGGEESVGSRRGLRVGGVMVYGVDSRFWELMQHGSVAAPGPGEVVLSEGVAAELGEAVHAGANVRLWMELPNAIPRDTLLGERDEDTIDMPLAVAAVIDERVPVARRGLGRFDLNPSQQAPKIAFVSLDTIQETMALQERRVRNREQRRIDVFPARVNTLVISGAEPVAAEEALRKSVALEDLGLSLRELKSAGYVAVESNRMVLDDAVLEAVDEMPTQSRVLVHLANRLSNADEPTKYSMYSIVAGVVPEEVAGKPFGPFVDNAGTDVMASLPDDGVVINKWLADDLGLDVGGRLKITYHLVGSHGELPEEVRTFRVHAVVDLEGVADDRGLTPHVPGITDVRTFRDWRQPFKMDLDALTQRDDDYWDDYRATPKAFVTYTTAVKLWQSRYGTATSLRVAAPSSRENLSQSLRGTVESSIDLVQMGLAVQPIKEHGLLAASGTTPFSGLFIGFSIFLIGAATILVGLLFRLGVERRVRGAGLLLALGFSPRRVLWLLVGEGGIVVLLGGLAGCLAGIGYARVMVYGLTHWWIDAVGTSFLEVEVRVGSLVLGGVISAAVALTAIVVSVRGLVKQPVRGLLAGAVRHEAGGESTGRSGRVCLGATAVIAVGVLCGVLLPGGMLSQEAFSGLSVRIVLFFVIGVSVLVAVVALFAAQLDRGGARLKERGRGFVGSAGLLNLGLRNAARHRSRSILSVSMVASAAFLIAAVAAGRRDPVNEWPDQSTGGGGFLLVAESSQPIIYDPGTTGGQAELDMRAELSSSQQALLETLDLHALRMKAGEESSCLNLYQTRRPTILGMSSRTIDRGGFRFVGASEENPWKLLEDMPHVSEGEPALPVFPVIGDMNTLQYSLHKGVGDRIAFPSDTAPEFFVEIVGMLDASIFQGVLVMSENHFRRAFPSEVGFRYFLVGDTRFGGAGETPDGVEAMVTSRSDQAEFLESRLGEYGFDAEPIVERLGRFLSVQNTYLATFQVLGGLGLLLGTIGLATVMQRNVLERRSELALLRAVGFRRGQVRTLVLCENALLLGWGLAGGTMAALIAMSPHLASAGGDALGLASSLGPLLVVVACVGMMAAVLAVMEAARTPVVAALRSE